MTEIHVCQFQTGVYVFRSSLYSTLDPPFIIKCYLLIEDALHMLIQQH